MFTAHNEDVNAVAFLDDSTDVFISGSDDALCKVNLLLICVFVSFLFYLRIQSLIFWKFDLNVLFAFVEVGLGPTHGG